jgi:hypothetical protein
VWQFGASSPQVGTDSQAELAEANRIRSRALKAPRRRRDRGRPGSAGWLLCKSHPQV